MNKLNYIFICCLSFAMLGCSIDNGHSKHFIKGYVHITGFFLFQDTHRNTLDIWFGWNGDDRYYAADFDTYSQRYNDLNFNGYTYQPFLAIAEPLDKISIVSDKNYDEGHPAGTPLDDIVKLNAQSAYRFIVVDHYKGSWGFDTVFKPIDELTREDMTLLHMQSLAAFLVFPQEGGPVGETHTLTVTITYMGEDISTTTEYTF